VLAIHAVLRITGECDGWAATAAAAAAAAGGACVLDAGLTGSELFVGALDQRGVALPWRPAGTRPIRVAPQLKCVCAPSPTMLFRERMVVACFPPSMPLGSPPQGRGIQRDSSVLPTVSGGLPRVRRRTRPRPGREAAGSVSISPAPRLPALSCCASALYCISHSSSSSVVSLLLASCLLSAEPGSVFVVCGWPGSCGPLGGPRRR
jgi:hypothetical protein